jgi:DNA polymerase II small subunit/DNA polymerase delta subunit B
MVFKKIFKILRTGLPMDHVHRYILNSWKIITANVSATVNSQTELQMIFHKWYVIFTDGYTDE